MAYQEGMSGSEVTRLLPESLYVHLKDPGKHVPSMASFKPTIEVALAWQGGPVLFLCPYPGLSKQLPWPGIPFPASGAPRLSHQSRPAGRQQWRPPLCPNRPAGKACI